MELKGMGIEFNKLVIVGNGFDLALGLKTGYNDFLFWLLKKYLLQTLDEKPVFTRDGKSYNVGYLNNENFEIGIKHIYSNISYKEEIEKLKTLDAFQKFQKECNIDFTIKSRLIKKYLITIMTLDGWILNLYFIRNLKNVWIKNRKIL